MAAAPVSPGDFARLMAPFAPFEPRPALAVGVSGGRDSMALALLAAGWAKAQGGATTALIVDHGLRPGSAAEARQVRRRLRERGIAARILVWSGAKPAADLQAAARAARYALLESWCRRAGVLHLLVAHQQDDQAETFLLRLARGSGLAGLAAMPAVAERAQLRLLRPLLPVPRARLAATLEAAGVPWIDEPGNLDLSRARARLRAALPALGGEGLTTARLTRTAAELGRARAALDAAVAALFAAAAMPRPAGFLWLDPAPLRAAPDELRLRVLAAALTAIGGADYPPRAADLDRLDAALARGPGPARTLGGCRIGWQAGRIMVCREAAAAGEVLVLGPGLRATWDRRFAVSVSGNMPRRLRLARLGEATGRLGDAARRAPRAALASLPALWHDRRLLAVPHLGYWRGATGRAAAAAVRIEFAPRRPLADAPFGIV